MAMKLKWQFGEALEAMEKEVNQIVNGKTVEEMLNELPAELPYDDIQRAKLVIKKLGDIVWQVSYMVFLDPRNKRFEKFSVRAVTEPSLKLALLEMLEELKKEGF